MPTPFLRACVGLALLIGITASVHAQAFVNFESPSVHPISISPDGSRLLVVNTPDNRLSVYSTSQPGAPVLLREVFVGIEPRRWKTRSTVLTRD